MKTKLSSLACFILMAPLCFAQVTKKTLELPEFKSIYLNSNYTVLVKQTNKQEVSVEAETDIYDLTRIYVENGVLMIDVERKKAEGNKSLWAKLDDIKLNPTLKVIVSMKKIDELRVNSAGKIVAENSLATNYVNLGVAGSGSIEADLKGDVIKAEVSGSGKIILKGYANSMEANISGSGSIQGFACPLETAKINVSGTGTCEANVTNNMDGVVNGSGIIKHKGNTKTITKKIYGTGTIDRAY